MSGSLSVEELVLDDSFCNYCFQNNEVDILFWEQYIRKHPSQRKVVDEAIQIVLGLREMLKEEEKRRNKEKPSENNHTVTIPYFSLKIKKNLLYAAASIFLILLTSVFLLFKSKNNRSEHIVINKVHQDVKAPKINRAMITLANGQKIFLDSVGNGTLAMQGNVKLAKLANGQIAYQAEMEEAFGDVQLNTLENPRGSQVINITLADGSKVWLNAGSSITYPVAFIGKERNVSINGEAYFEIAHDRERPFRVGKGNMHVEVLGTHFNVNAYDDDADIKITLLEGAVKVNKSNLSSILKPGQQAKITKEINVVEQVDTEAVLAWKNGLFHFEKASLQEVLKQLARWYDVEIVYEHELPAKKFVGEMERGLTLSQVLRIFDKHKVRFKISGRKLIVRP